jgi:hypothetical protein
LDLAKTRSKDATIFLEVTMESSIEVLKREREKLVRMTKVLDDSIKALGGEMSDGRKKTGKRFSAATRKKIGLAQAKRWAKFRAEKKKAEKSA